MMTQDEVLSLCVHSSCFHTHIYSLVGKNTPDSKHVIKSGSVAAFFLHMFLIQQTCFIVLLAGDDFVYGFLYVTCMFSTIFNVL